jgi:hypothetical protein
MSIAVEFWTMQPDAIEPIFFDFENLLSTGDSIDGGGSPTVTASPSSGITIGTPGITGNIVNVKVTNPTGPVLYYLKCVATTTLGYTLVLSGRLFVRDGTV